MKAIVRVWIIWIIMIPISANSALFFNQSINRKRMVFVLSGIVWASIISLVCDCPIMRKLVYLPIFLDFFFIHHSAPHFYLFIFVPYFSAFSKYFFLTKTFHHVASPWDMAWRQLEITQIIKNKMSSVTQQKVTRKTLQFPSLEFFDAMFIFCTFTWHSQASFPH